MRPPVLWPDREKDIFPTHLFSLYRLGRHVEAFPRALAGNGRHRTPAKPVKDAAHPDRRRRPSLETVSETLTHPNGILSVFLKNHRYIFQVRKLRYPLRNNYKDQTARILRRFEKESFIMSNPFSAALLTLGITFAAPSLADMAVLGELRDTSAAQAGYWQVNALGLPNYQLPGGTWKSNEVELSTLLALPGKGYVTAAAVDPAFAESKGWRNPDKWISAPHDYLMTGANGWGENGYYAYTTVINDFGYTSSDPALEFNGLWINLSADDHLHAIVVNGVVYDGFAPQAEKDYGWDMDPLGIRLDAINWIIGGENTIGFILHNNNSFNGTNDFANLVNATGLSASIQAAYLNNVPEPGTYALTLLGLGLMGVFARRRHNAHH